MFRVENAIRSVLFTIVAFNLTIQEIRRKHCHRKRLLSNPDLFRLVKSKFLDHQWSPEQIQNRLKHEKSVHCISYNTIYRAVYRGDFNEKGLSSGNRGRQ